MGAELFLLLQAGLAMGAIYGLVALGFHLLFITTNIVNFSTGYIAVLGGLLVYTFLETFHLSTAMALISTVVAGMLLGLLFGTLVIGPVRRKGFWVQTMAVLAAGMVLENIYLLIWGKEPLRVLAFTGAPVLLGDWILLPKYLWVIALAAGSVLLLNLFLNRTLTGKSMLASANNPVLGRLMGIDANRVVVLAFVTSFTLVALAGALITPIAMAGGERTLFLTIKGFTACVIGNIYSTTGSVVGGSLLGLTEIGVIRYVGSDYAEISVACVLLGFLLLRPQGLFPQRIRVA